MRSWQQWRIWQSTCLKRIQGKVTNCWVLSDVNPSFLAMQGLTCHDVEIKTWTLVSKRRKVGRFNRLFCCSRTLENVQTLPILKHVQSKETSQIFSPHKYEIMKIILYMVSRIKPWNYVNWFWLRIERVLDLELGTGDLIYNKTTLVKVILKSRRLILFNLLLSINFLHEKLLNYFIFALESHY